MHSALPPGVRPSGSSLSCQICPEIRGQDAINAVQTENWSGPVFHEVGCKCYATRFRLWAPPQLDFYQFHWTAPFTLSERDLHVPMPSAEQDGDVDDICG